MTGGTGAASAKQVTNNGSQFGNAWVDEGHSHQRLRNGHGGTLEGASQGGGITLHPSQGATCTLCGAWKGELGSEADPNAFVAHLVEVFAAVRRVLRDDGLLIVNLADSYSGSGKGPTGRNGLGDQGRRQGFVNQRDAASVPAKSLYLIPERFALAMLEDGWLVRSRLAGVKVAPMPESCRDRPTSAWEHVYMFSRPRSYYWDQNAVRQRTGNETDPVEYARLKAIANDNGDWYTRYDTTEKRTNGTKHGKQQGGIAHPAGANLRNWFTWPPASFPGAHFATFPPAVPELFIKAATRPGDLVLDPFSGAGTSVLVANRLGRRGLGLELNPDYAELARRRIEDDAPLVHAIAAAPAVAQERLL